MPDVMWVLTVATAMLCTSAIEGAAIAGSAALEDPPSLEGGINDDYVVRLALWAARRAITLNAQNVLNAEKYLNAQKPDTVAPATPGPIPAPAPPRPLKSADVTRKVTVQRDAYVELQCPIEGSPVTWTVVYGQPTVVMTARLLVFPRMGGPAAQEYRCEVSNRTAALLLSVIDDIPADQKDGDINYCRHGTLCLVPCADKAEWEGVNCTKEQWTPLTWTTAYKVIYHRMHQLCFFVGMSDVCISTALCNTCYLLCLGLTIYLCSPNHSSLVTEFWQRMQSPTHPEWRATTSVL